MMNRSSSSCLLRSRYGSCESLHCQQQKQQPQQRVTIITTKRLPSYSAERYYMLSELEEHASSLQYLHHCRGSSSSNMGHGSLPSLNTATRRQDDNEAENNTDTTTTISSSSLNSQQLQKISAPQGTVKIHPSQHIILYMLWNPLQHNVKQQLDTIEDAILYIRSQEQQHQPPTTQDANSTTEYATSPPCNVVQTDHTANTSAANLLSCASKSTANTGVKIHLVVDRIRPISEASLVDDIILNRCESSDYDLGIDEQQPTFSDEFLTNDSFPEEEEEVVNLVTGSLNTVTDTRDAADDTTTSKTDQSSFYQHKIDHQAVEKFSRIIAKSPIIR